MVTQVDTQPDPLAWQHCKAYHMNSLGRVLTSLNSLRTAVDGFEVRSNTRLYVSMDDVKYRGIYEGMGW